MVLPELLTTFRRVELAKAHELIHAAGTGTIKRDLRKARCQLLEEPSLELTAGMTLNEYSTADVMVNC